jgi:hypothetical protein
LSHKLVLLPVEFINSAATIRFWVEIMIHKKVLSQANHDECVRTIADELKKDKWEVKANLEGWAKPSKTGAFTPDIEAKKEGCLSRICEVATKEMFEGDRQRYVEFKNYCDEYDFHFYIVDKDGKHRQINPETFGKK